jgi:transcriptional regulator with XRE-family HTH domain
LPADTAPSVFDHAKLRAWRDEAHVSREVVCAATSLSFNYLKRLESGDSPSPTLAVIARLAHYYGHDPGELLVSAPVSEPT